MQKCNDASVGNVAALKLNQMNNEHTTWLGRNVDQYPLLYLFDCL